MTGKEEHAVRRPVHVVGTKIQLDGFARRAAAQPHPGEAVSSPFAEIDPLTVCGDFNAIQARAFASGDLRPTGTRVPSPELTRDPASERSLARGG